MRIICAWTNSSSSNPSPRWRPAAASPPPPRRKAWRRPSWGAGSMRWRSGWASSCWCAPRAASRLTHEGSAFLEDCQRLLADIANAEASVSAGGVKASGHLRITAPAGFGRRHVAPLVPKLPRAACRRDDLAEPERPRGRPGGRGLRLRRARRRPARLLAGERAPGRQPPAVRGHAGIPEAARHAAASQRAVEVRLPHAVQRRLADPRLGLSRSASAEGERSRSISSRAVRSTAPTARCCTTGAWPGWGIAWRSTWEVESEIAAGRLAEVLAEFAAPPNGIYAVFPQRKHLPLRVRLWIDFLKHNYSQPEFWTTRTLPMTLEALLAYAHLLAILTHGGLHLQRGGAVPAGVDQRRRSSSGWRTVDMVYGIAAVAVLLTGLARTWWGIKGTPWYWGNGLLHLKLALFVAVALISIKPTLMFSALGQAARGRRRPAGGSPGAPGPQVGDGAGPPDRRDSAGGGVPGARLRRQRLGRPDHGPSRAAAARAGQTLKSRHAPRETRIARQPGCRAGKAFPRLRATRRRSNRPRSRPTATSPAPPPCSWPSRSSRTRASWPKACARRCWRCRAFARWVEAIEIAGPGFLNIRLKPEAKQQIVREVLAAGAGLRQPAAQRQAHDGRIRLGQSRPARCTWATAARLRWATPSATCTPRRAGTSTASSITTTPACRSPRWPPPRSCAPRASSPATPSGPRPPTTATTSPTSPHDFLAKKTVKADDREFTASGDVDDLDSHPPVRRGLPAPRAGPGPAGLRRRSSTTTTSSPASTPAARSTQAVKRLQRGRQDLRAGRRAVAQVHRLRRRQGPRHAQVRRQLHLLRAGRRLPHHQVGARLRQGGQHPGHRPPRHHRPRARRPAGGGRRHPAGLSRLRAAHHGARDARRRGSEDLQARRQLRHACAT